MTAEAHQIKLALTGRFRRGKDTLAEMVKNYQEQRGGRVLLTAFADALKTELADMVYNAANIESTGLSRKDWRAKMRDLREVNGVGWQWWGEFRRRVYGQDYWIRRMERTYTSSPHDGRSVIITDLRHHNEAQWCREHGFDILRVTGPCRAKETRDPNHPSERHIDELPTSFEFDNSGTLLDMEQFVKYTLMPNLAIGR